LIARHNLHVAATVLAHKLKSGVNPPVFNVINAKILSVIRRLMHLQVPLYLAFTKKKWFDYLQCIFDSIPLRKAAQRVNIDLTTAFRWRHRFLTGPTKIQTKNVSGIVEADRTFFLESFKGKRSIEHRKRRGGKKVKEGR
jgi:hypothetical protein